MTQPALPGIDAVPEPRRPVLDPVELSHRLGEDHPPTRQQAAAISAPLAPHVVVAGAGSGKTQTMGLRVVWLVANGLVPPHRVLGLTFTRKAATELGERVRRMLRRLEQAHHRSAFLADDVVAQLAAGEPTVATYHAYAAALVGEHALRVGLEPGARLIGEAMSWQLAAEVVEGYDGSMEAVDRAVSTVTADVLSLAGDLAEHLADADRVRDLTTRVRSHLTGLPRATGQRGKGGLPASVQELVDTLDGRLALLPLVARYAERKQARGAMDYGDQVAVAARIARGHPEVGEIERARFGAVLLDEYQDTGEAQRVLLRSLFGAGGPVTAVGDPRQSIYGWRGASAGNLERFLDDFAGDPAAGAGGLSVSFRNGSGILAAANAVAAGIPVRVRGDRELEPGPGREGKGRLVVSLHHTVVDEAAWIADEVAALGTRTSGPLPWGGIAVLARKRSHFPRVEAELRARGVPCEVVGLGGLLLEPEVVDVVSTLRVLGDPGSGGAVVRLLTGPRWRIGAHDLAALGRRARRLAVGRRLLAGPGGAPTPDGPGGPDGADGSGDASAGGGVAAEDLDPEYDEVDERSLVDALDDPGHPDAYSAEGYRRLLVLRDELRGLRRWTAQPVPDLVAAVARTLCLDIELAARPGVRPEDALRNVDRFVEVAEDFVEAGEEPGLLAFLAYLDAADERERGLEPDVAALDGDRVQLLTVHAAKGLEWDAVFVAGLTEKVFPVEGQPVADWTKQIFALPFPLRGDAAELPALDWAATADQKQAKDSVDGFRTACRARAAMEERRLAYVAVTRARDLLACSGYWWDTAVTCRGPSGLLTELAGVARATGGEVAVWADQPEEDAENPVIAEPVVRPWPYDPLGGRRPAVEAAARLVRDPSAAPAVDLDPAQRQQVERWEEERGLLLAELERSRRRRGGVVELPAHLSVSQLVTLRRDPAELARSLRRPMPRRPAPQARRGTRFHLWLEQRWGQQRLLDVDELPGAADDTAEPDADLVALQEAFRASEWWDRVPADVEFPFDLVVEGVLLRGRCDAVFDDDPDGFVDVVDWKTGPPKSGADATAAAVQLAVYRLAWHHLSGVPLDRIRAAFHHVGVNRTVRPADLLGHGELVELVRSVPLLAPDAGEVAVDGG